MKTMRRSVLRGPGGLVTAGLALLPMFLSVIGVAVDEMTHLGFTTWRAACRAAGLSLTSLAAFTLQLLPSAVIGALTGGLIVLVAGFTRRRIAGGALAAHAGCALAMGPGLLLCASGVVWPLALGVELAAAAGLALSLRALPIRSAT